MCFFYTDTDVTWQPRTSVKWQILDYYLKDHPDRALVEWCLDSFKNGFSLGMVGTPSPWPDPKNGKKVLKDPETTWKLIKDEIDKGFILGPFKTRPIKDLFCVPINIVEKEMSSGLYRLIQDFSFPWGDPNNGINVLVPSENKKVKYAGMDQVAELALRLGPKSEAIRIDIKSAFKLLPLSVRFWKFTGFKFRQAFFIQTQTPFGATASCLHFERVAGLIEWVILDQINWALMTHYLDDFWLTQKTRALLRLLAENFVRIVEQEMGFPISHNKTLGPAQVLDFVGLTADLVNMCITLPDAKRKKVVKMINKLLKAYEKGTFVTVKDLEKCTGTLNFATQAIPVGRPWLQ